MAGGLSVLGLLSFVSAAVKLAIELSYHGPGPLCCLQRFCDMRKSGVRWFQFLLSEFTEANACSYRVPDFEDYSSNQAGEFFNCKAAYWVIHGKPPPCVSLRFARSGFQRRFAIATSLQ